MSQADRVESADCLADLRVATSAARIVALKREGGMTRHDRSVIVGPGEGATIEGPVGGPLTFKVRGEQSGGSFTASENVVPPGQGPPLHTHASEDEAWYVLDGELRFKLDGDLRTAPVGSFVFVPRGTPHCFQNVGETDARILVMFMPSGMERFFDEFASLSAPDPGAFAKIGAPLGMSVIGPPLAQSDPR